MIAHRPYSQTLWNVIASVVLFHLPVLAAGLSEGVSPTIEPDFGMLDRPFFEILVVSARQINPAPHTNEHPPRGIFEVHEVLRGHVKNDFVELVWSPPETGEDHEPPLAGDSDPSYRRPLKAEWYQRRLPAPGIGEKIVVFAVDMPRPLSDSAEETKGSAYIREIQKNIAKSRRTPFLDVRAAFVFNDINRQTILNNMGLTDRNPRIQVLVFLLLLSLTPFSIVLVALSFVFQRVRCVQLLKAAVLVAGLSLPLYIYYETGNRTGGIRLDVFILYPALLVNVIVLAVAIILVVTRGTDRAGPC